MKSIRKILADSVQYFTRRGFGSNKWKKQFAYFGEGARIDWPARISGYEYISIGNNSVILDHSRLANFYTNAPTPPPSLYHSVYP